MPSYLILLLTATAIQQLLLACRLNTTLSSAQRLETNALPLPKAQTYLNLWLHDKWGLFIKDFPLTETQMAYIHCVEHQAVINMV